MVDLWLERITLPINLADLGVPNGIEIITLEHAEHSPDHVATRIDTVYGRNNNSGRGCDIGLVGCVRLPFPVDLYQGVMRGNHVCGGPMVEGLLRMLRGFKKTGYNTPRESLSFPFIQGVYLVREGDFLRDSDFAEALHASP